MTTSPNRLPVPPLSRQAVAADAFGTRLLRALLAFVERLTRHAGRRERRVPYY